MRGPGRLHVRVLAGMLAAAATASTAATPVALPSGEYELTTETVLPHLEEALRYATTRTRDCLHAPDATAMFPILRHPAFTGCTLVPAPTASDGLRFALRCANPEAASGTAAFDVDASRFSAVLELKMGGKNMTLSQRLQGTHVGACTKAGSPRRDATAQ